MDSCPAPLCPRRWFPVVTKAGNRAYPVTGITVAGQRWTLTSFPTYASRVRAIDAPSSINDTFKGSTDGLRCQIGDAHFLILLSNHTLPIQLVRHSSQFSGSTLQHDHQQPDQTERQEMKAVNRHIQSCRFPILTVDKNHEQV